MHIRAQLVENVNFLVVKFIVFIELTTNQKEKSCLGSRKSQEKMFSAARVAYKIFNCEKLNIEDFHDIFNIALDVRDYLVETSEVNMKEGTISLLHNKPKSSRKKR